jgi:coenzyme PQQ precursor peptide PqqA
MERKNRPQSLATTTTRDSNQDRDRVAVVAKSSWHKPELREISCGLEINCYATSTGRR